MSPDLQVLVDQLAETLERPAMIDDVQWRAVAYSPVDERVDGVRLRSILHRRAPEDAVAWASRLGVDDATAPVRMPGNPSLGADPRLLINLRHDHLFLGRLVMVDHDATISDREVSAAERSADEIARVLHHRRMIEGGARERERELLRDLLGEHPNARARAAHTIQEEGLLSGRSLAALLVIRVPDGERTPATGQWSVLERVTESVARAIGANRSLSLVRSEHAIVLVGASSEGEVRELACEARDRAAADAGVDVTIGTCPLADALDDGETGLRRATEAARVAARIPRFESVASWSELGGYGALIRLIDGDPMEAGLLDPAVRRLMAADRHGALLHTLESFLDLGGDIQRTAQHVSLQRAGLYYRLRRIQEITDVDLKDGEARLGLHMSIKLLRLAGGPRLPEPRATT